MHEPMTEQILRELQESNASFNDVIAQKFILGFPASNTWLMYVTVVRNISHSDSYNNISKL